MDRSAGIRQLPGPHAVAIRLRDEGLDDHVIAVALEIDDEGVPTLLELANRKLRNVMDAETDDPHTQRHDLPPTRGAEQATDQGASS